MIEFLKKLRPYTLLIAITSGLMVFVFTRLFPVLEEAKPIADLFLKLLPLFIFTMLFLAFSKLDVKQMKPKRWHYLLLLLQASVTTAIALFLYYNKDCSYAIILKGAIVCIITPTACAAAVLTGKLGGNESSVTSYILLRHVLAAFLVPCLFPLISDKGEHSFVDELLHILSQTAPLIGFPLLSALFIKYFLKKLNAYIVSISSLSFYLWAITVFAISAQTFFNIAASTESSYAISLMAATGLFCCIAQFAIGKAAGHVQGQRISAGQGLGQKNMLFGTWTALAYLSDTVAIIPGTYILWQNLVNAWQMSHREKMLKIWSKEGKDPYQEK